MKKLFLILILVIAASSTVAAQSNKSDLIGTWKIVGKTSGFQGQPLSEFILLMDDSLYTTGVDSVGNTLSDASSGRWSVISEGVLVLYPSDRIAERRYYKPVSENKFRFIGTTLKKNAPMLEMDIFLEKYLK